MSTFKNFGWGATLRIHSNDAATTIIWPEDAATAAPSPQDGLAPPADLSQGWYYQHPGRYVNTDDVLSNVLRQVAARWEAHGLTARQGEYLRDACGRDPWEVAIERGICPAREVYCPPDRVGSMPYWQAVQPRLRVGWQPLVPFIGAPSDQRVC